MNRKNTRKKNKKNSYKENVTSAITEASMGYEYTPMNFVMELTPELDRLYEIRNKITEKILKNQPIEKINNLFELVHSINLMKISYKKLAKNDGAGTEGSEQESIENFSITQMETLSEQLINNNFQWKNVKQILIPRKGKTPRPLGLPNFSEKIIQNNILMILESIFEPIFEQYNFNYGFRPHKGCIDAIEQIMHYKNQGLNWVIEGDIKSAFDNIHPPKLANILYKYTDDKKFVQLIFDSCTTPIINKNGIIIPSPEGTSQGSIISPILFNIYMHELDLDIINILTETQIENQPPKIIKAPRTKAYERIKTKIRKLKEDIESIENIKKIRQLTIEESQQIRTLKNKMNQIINIRNRINSYDYTKLPLRYYYNRYADDFVILINKSRQICITIIEKLEKILKEKYYLQLSIEKTAITKLKTEHAKYLGFTLFMQKRPPVIRRNTDYLVRTGRHILAGPDLTRIYNRLKLNKYCTNNLEPIGRSAFITLEIQEIIEKYNSIMSGIYNYYLPIITYKSEIHRIYYILYYSCIKTIARKLNISMRKVHQQLGWEEYNTKNQPTKRIRIVFTYYTFNKNMEPNLKFSILLNHRDLTDIANKIIEKRNIWKNIKSLDKDKKAETNLALQTILEIQNSNPYIKEGEFENLPLHISDHIQFEDIWKKYKINWRTTFKLTMFCNICGSTEKLETHHIRKIKGPTIDKDDTFTQTIMKNLNRKQLVLCHNCHLKVHSGQYNGLSLTDLYDTRTSKIENFFKK